MKRQEWVVTPTGIKAFVSTVKLDYDNLFVRAFDQFFREGGTSAPYETMVFPRNSVSDAECVQYLTEQEAENGHALVVERVKAGEFDDELKELEALGGEEDTWVITNED